MNLVSEQVRHGRFGMGTIIRQTETMVEVRFDDFVGLKKFNYPSAFESFLELCRPALKATMDEALSAIREQAEAERSRRMEAERHRVEAVRELMAQHTAAKKAAKPKAKTSKARKATGAAQ
jgi:hypothetical protein